MAAGPAPVDGVDLGFRRVAPAEKDAAVGAIFSRIAARYDFVNDVMSLGLHRAWKAAAVRALRLAPGDRVLDAAGGTGDLALRALPAARPAGEGARPLDARPPRGGVVVLDASEAMLKVGRRRAARLGLEDGLEWVHGNAERLPFPDESFDAYVIGYGLRNVSDRDAALREALRVLRPGGRYACLDFSQVHHPLLRAIWEWYSFNVIPLLGRIFVRDEASYRYLAESVAVWWSQAELADHMRAAGFSGVGYQNRAFGVAAIHTGVKLSSESAA